MVFSTGFRTDSPTPLDLDLLGEEIVDSFTDLIYGGRPHSSIRIELEFEEEGEKRPVLLDVTVQNVDEYRMQIISSLSTRVGESEVRLEWEQDDPLRDERLYTIAADG